MWRGEVEGAGEGDQVLCPSSQRFYLALAGGNLRGDLRGASQ